MQVEPGGHAVWLCHRCGWTGTTAGEERHKSGPSRRPAAAPKPEAVAARHEAELDATKVWRASLPITADSVAARYLIGRGCCLPHHDGDLRWAPDQWRSPQWTGPALVALVRDAITAEPMTVHRTWLASDGSGKAAVDKPRLIWKGLPKKGGVIRLWPNEEITLGLCVAEGIETALTAARGFGSAWSTIDKGNLAALPVLPGIEALTIVVDHDPAGIAAADTCTRRWVEAGVEVHRWTAPTAGTDLNDYARTAS